MVKSALKFTPDDAGTRISADDFATADFQAPYIYERVQGRLVVMTPAGPEHRRISRPFRKALGGYWERHPEIVEDVDVEGWVATDSDTDRLPDICVYLTGSAKGQTVPHRVPDLIFEFVSAERSDQERDYVAKGAEYQRIGVREYVIVDRFKRSVLVLTWEEGDFVERTLERQSEYTTPLLPGLVVSLGEVFA